MKKIILAAVAATIAVPAAAAPGDTATDQGSATATIVAPISILHDGGALDFGVIVSPTVNSTVTVSAGSASTTSGDAVVLSGGAADSFTDSFTGLTFLGRLKFGLFLTLGTHFFAASCGIHKALLHFRLGLGKRFLFTSVALFFQKFVFLD